MSFCDKNLTVSPELLDEILESGDLRPAAQVYVCESVRDPETLNALLNAHESAQTVGKLRAQALE